MITTKDGVHCQVYSNEHPEGKILIKPKYIPTDRVASNALPFRFISGTKMNRLNLWIDKGELKDYIDAFCKAYPDYVFRSDAYDKSPLFFAVGKYKIDRIYSPRDGLSNLMSIPEKDLDKHLKTISEFVRFLLKSNLKLEDLGITYSTLMGHYSQNMSDINIVVYGKKKFWQLMNFLGKNSHEKLRWKTYEEWENFYKKRNRHMIHKKDLYIKNMNRKKSEGFFNDTLFVIFAVENEDETWFKFGNEKYKRIGVARFKGEVTDNRDSVVRPGCYDLANTQFVEGEAACRNLQLSKIVFYSRDYCMLAYPREKIEMEGVVEEVTANTGEKYHRMVIGYFDSYINGRRDDEYIKVVDE